LWTDRIPHNIDIIELGIPFTDPIADGPTIQKANTKALENGVTVTSVLEMVRTARSRGLKTPVMLMGYYNPVLRYGDERMLKDCKEAGVNGFIMVDLPPEEAVRFRDLCASYGYVLPRLEKKLPILIPFQTLICPSHRTRHFRLSHEASL
jgi:tryptophan synthase alpha subunit